ncbi:MAG: DUF4118 domain-containing protein, partial [Terracidiphilus sp.]
MADPFSTVFARPAARYSLAVVAVALSFLLRSGLNQPHGAELPPFIFLYPAVMIAAVLGGLGPGLLSTALSVLATDYFVLPPTHHFAISRASDAVALTVFAAMGLLMSLLAERHLRSQRAIAIYRSEKALRATEALFRTLFNSMEEGFCVIEVIFDANQTPLDYRFLEANPAFEKQTGMPNPVGRTMREFAPELEDYWCQLFGNVALTGEPAHFLNEAKAIHGFFDVRAYRIGEPELRHVAVVFSEISDRMREETALREQAELLDLAHDTIMVRDLDGTIRFWNHGAEEMYGIPSAQAVGRPTHELFNTEFPFPRTEIETILLETGRWEGELTHTAEDGTVLIVDSRWALQRDKQGAPTSVMQINSDITKRKHAEEHTRRLNRVYTMLSDINQTIVREKDSQAMLESACRIAVEKGRFRMAWIGMVNHETNQLEPIASGGMVGGYLDRVKIDLLEEGTAAGPAAHSFHSGEHSICNDIEHEFFRPWKNDALQNGYRSMAAFPLRCEGKIVGVFCLYATEIAFFDEDET